MFADIKKFSLSSQGYFFN